MFLVVEFQKIFCDAPVNWQLGIQDPATPMLEGMIHFHGFLDMILVIIGTGVCYLLGHVFFTYSRPTAEKPSKFSHNSNLEIGWTLLPAFTLFIIASPSFELLYSLEDNGNASFSLKIIGHQWFWSYELKEINKFGQIIWRPEIYLKEYVKGSYRLLETLEIFLPMKKHIRLLVTASDVLHSWAVPSFGIKIDACPGRLSQVALFIKRIGTFYGQCSEICGIRHGFMPITVVVVSEHVLKSR